MLQYPSPYVTVSFPVCYSSLPRMLQQPSPSVTAAFPVCYSILPPPLQHPSPYVTAPFPLRYSTLPRMLQQPSPSVTVAFPVCYSTLPPPLQHPSPYVTAPFPLRYSSPGPHPVLFSLLLHSGSDGIQRLLLFSLQTSVKQITVSKETAAVVEGPGGGGYLRAMSRAVLRPAAVKSWCSIGA